MNLHRLTFEQAVAYQTAVISEINALVREGAPATAFRAERAMMSHLRLCDTWGFGVYALVPAAHVDPVGVIAVGHTKRGHREWGRYANVYVVHVRVGARHNGFAAAAYRAAADDARRIGCRRLTTTAATYGGWRTHRTLGWPAWGVNRSGEIVTDTDLTGDSPEGVPARCRNLDGPGRPLTSAEHARHLTDPRGPYRLPLQALPAPYRETP